MTPSNALRCLTNRMEFENLLKQVLYYTRTGMMVAVMVGLFGAKP